jgi:hypothetical protein
MANLAVASVQIGPANPAAIAAAQTPTSTITLTAQPVKLDAPRRVVVTTTGAEAGKTIALLGTGRGGSQIRETITLVSSGTAVSKQDFLTVKSATISAPAAAALTMGTNNTASTKWIELTPHISPFSATVECLLTAAGATGQVEVAIADIEALSAEGYEFLPAVWPLPGYTSGNIDALFAISQPVAAVRLTITGGAQTSPAIIAALQAGI